MLKKFFGFGTLFAVALTKHELKQQNAFDATRLKINL